ncbi:MAG TPA: hypothetical protein VFO73_15875 [Candidatus Limnocylindrales bacterium]|nr:hypothetical protein [Candidatus Limnocylindrales bacterium]
MRSSNHSALRLVTMLATVLTGLAACAGPAPSSAPPATPRPTPVITPDPHLTEPATADEIFTAIRVGKLPLAVNNATAGDPNSPVVKRINADIGNWPLIITQFRSGELLRETMKWDPAKPPAQGNAPYTFVGLNIVIEFGPTTGKLASPDAARQEQAARLVALVDPLLWPLEQRSVAPLATKTAPPPSGAPSPATAAATAKP